MTNGDEGVWDPGKIYLCQKGGVALTENHFYAPMYGDLSEVLDLLKISFEGLTRKNSMTTPIGRGMRKAP